MCDFRSSLLSKNTPRLRAPLVGTMIDPPTVGLGAANVDCCCLVVTQTHSVLSVLSLSLFGCIYPHRSSIQAENFGLNSPLQACNRNKPAYRRHIIDSTDHDAVWSRWCLWCTGRKISYMHYVKLRYIMLHYVILGYITLHYVTLRYITLHYVTFRYITLHTVALRCITLHHITLYCIVLHYITLHYIT